MTSTFWASLFALRDAVDLASMASARRLLEVRQSSEQETPVCGVVLSHLHVEVRNQLEGWTSLILMPTAAPFGVESDAARCLRFVSFWLNERVCSRLGADDSGDYTPVGPADVNLLAGGVLFFDEVERLLLQRLGAPVSGASTPAQAALDLSCDVALFALEQGFSGVHVGDVARLEAFKVRLRRGALPPIVEAPSESPTLPRDNTWRTAVLCAAVVGFYLCSAWLSQGIGGM